MKKMNQKGFGTHGIILIVVVLVIVGVVGWIVYKKQAKTKQNAQTAAVASESSIGTSGSSKDGFLAIPELGIQLKLGAGVTDATYKLMPDGDSFGISTQTLQNQYGDSCSAASGNVASIAVFVNSNGPNPGTGAQGLQTYPDAFKSADGTYYALNYTPIKSAFCGNAGNNQAAADALQKQVVDGFSKTKVQKIQY